jgi:hypothetical protein
MHHTFRSVTHVPVRQRQVATLGIRPVAVEVSNGAAPAE